MLLYCHFKANTSSEPVPWHAILMFKTSQLSQDSFTHGNVVFSFHSEVYFKLFLLQNTILLLFFNVNSGRPFALFFLIDNSIHLWHQVYTDNTPKRQIPNNIKSPWWLSCDRHSSRLLWPKKFCVLKPLRDFFHAGSPLCLLVFPCSSQLHIFSHSLV